MITSEHRAVPAFPVHLACVGKHAIEDLSTVKYKRPIEVSRPVHAIPLSL